MSTLVGELAARDISAAFLWPVATDWSGYERWIMQTRPDAIIVNGEGTIHHSAERKRTRDLLALPVFARRHGLPIHLLNASVSALDAAALEALRGFDTVHVRESDSLAYLEAHGLDAKMVPDLSLGLSVPPASAPREGIIVTDSVLQEVARDLRTFSLEMGARYERMKPKRPHGAKLREKLRTLWPGPSASRQWSPRSDATAFASRLASNSLAVTGRFHTVLLSIATDTPFIAFPSNTPKIEAVLRDAFGNTSRVRDVAVLEEPLFRTEARRGIPFSADELAALARYRAAAAEARREMFERIASSVK